MLSKVSIILPTFNGSKYLCQSIDSCLSQTHLNIELVIVDDCSNDSTPDIIKSYADPRIKYIRNATNQRLPRSLNIGFEASSGDYLTWTSDDNYYLPKAIEVMVNHLVSHNYDFVFCDYYSLPQEDKAAAKLIRLPAEVSFRYINPIRACFMYTRKVKKITGDYDPELELVEDYDYWIRVSQNFTMHHIDQALYYYRVHDQQLYTTRYWEVEVVKLLTRAKYDVCAVEECDFLFRQNLTRKLGKDSFLFRIYAKIFLSRIICAVFRDFRAGTLNFKEAKTILNRFINGNFSRVGK